MVFAITASGARVAEKCAVKPPPESQIAAPPFRRATGGPRSLSGGAGEGPGGLLRGDLQSGPWPSPGDCPGGPCGPPGAARKHGGLSRPGVRGSPDTAGPGAGGRATGVLGAAFPAEQEEGAGEQGARGRWFVRTGAVRGGPADGA